MDPGEQPHILRFLTQVEEFLIACVNPIFQVTHARCGKYKYIGHTLSFRQDISTIIQSIPRHVKDIDFLFVRRHVSQSKYYEWYVKISRVMVAFIFKIKHDKYYEYVVIDYNSVNAMPERSTNVSSSLKFVDCDIEESEINATNNEGLAVDRFPSHLSSFVSHLPNE